MKDLRFKYTVISNLFYVLRTLPKANKYIAHPEIYSEEERFELAKEIMHRMRTHARTSTDVYGEENLLLEGGYLMYANHQGRYDGIGILLSQPKPCSVLWKKDRAEYFMVRQVSSLIKAKTIDTEKWLETAKTLSEMGKDVESGKRYLIFPEGHYDKNKNTLQEFKDGCFKCALKSKVPIIPVVVYDSYKSMNSNTFEKVNTQVHYLKPIFYEEYGTLRTADIAELVKSRIQTRLDEIKSGESIKKSFSII